MFAKLFGPDENQILAVFEANNDGNPAISVTVEHAGMLIRVSPSWSDTDAGWDQAEKAFADLDEAMARRFVQPTIDLLASE